MYTLYELAEKLRISYTSVVHFVQAGKIKAVKIGRRWFVSEEELNRVMKEGT